jgi:hypothetical protein
MKDPGLDSQQRGMQVFRAFLRLALKTKTKSLDIAKCLLE